MSNEPTVYDLLKAASHILDNSYTTTNIEVCIRFVNETQASTATVGDCAVTEFSSGDALREAILQACAKRVRDRDAANWTGFRPQIAIGGVPCDVNGQPKAAEAAPMPDYTRITSRLHDGDLNRWMQYPDAWIREGIDAALAQATDELADDLGSRHVFPDGEITLSLSKLDDAIEATCREIGRRGMASVPAVVAEPEMVRVFGSADAYGVFDLRNCCECAQSIHRNNLRPPYRCDIETAIDKSQTIPAALARRAGLPGGTVCPERVAQ